MSGSKYRTIVVKESVNIAPHMQRVTFTGDDLVDFPANYESGYVKLLFTSEGRALSDKNQVEQRHMTRTYTVRSFDRETNELGIEFSLHGAKSGPATRWAASTQPGDKIVMNGPGAIKRVNNQSDWFLLASDMSGLPALCCNVEQLPAQARGYAVIEIPSEADRRSLEVPVGVVVKWVINDRPGEKPEALLNAIQSLPWNEGSPYVWVACEFESMKKIRQYLQESHDIKKDQMYISSYWKHNRTEEQHRLDKKIDAGAPQFVQFLWKVATGG